jgi:hypothetical protein
MVGKIIHQFSNFKNAIESERHGSTLWSLRNQMSHPGGSKEAHVKRPRPQPRTIQLLCCVLSRGCCVLDVGTKYGFLLFCFSTNLFGWEIDLYN